MTARHTSASAVAALTLSVTLYSVNQGLSYPLLALLLDKKGASGLEIGLSAAMTPVGIIASSAYVNKLAARWGQASLLSSAIVGTGVCLFALAFLPVAAWYPIRFLLGAFINAFYIAAETAVNQLAPAERRGRLIAKYTGLTTLGYAAGPLLLAVLGTDGPAPFVAVAALLPLAYIATERSRSDLNTAHAAFEGPTPTIRAFLALAPVLVVANAAATFFDSAVMTLLPVYGISVGLESSVAAIGLTVLMLGGVAAQYPTGWLSDRIGPARVMLASSASAVLLTGALVLGGGSLVLFLIASFALGGAVLSLQTSTQHELGNVFEGPMLAAGNAAFGFTWGLLSAVGVPLSGWVLDAVGPQGTWIVPALMFALTAALMFGYISASQRKAHSAEHGNADQRVAMSSDG